MRAIIFLLLKRQQEECAWGIISSTRFCLLQKLIMKNMLILPQRKFDTKSCLLPTNCYLRWLRLQGLGRVSDSVSFPRESCWGCQLLHVPPSVSLSHPHKSITFLKDPLVSVLQDEDRMALQVPVLVSPCSLLCINHPVLKFFSSSWCRKEKCMARGLH